MIRVTVTETAPFHVFPDSLFSIENTILKKR